MIWLGLDNIAKREQILGYCEERSIKKVFILSPEKFKFDLNREFIEWVEYADIIRYKYYYRLLQEIDNQTLVVVNECLRTQNRYNLTYNCIRNYLNQTKHQLIFQYLPMIENIEDFMILFDFDTRSRWKREKFNKDLLGEAKIQVIHPRIEFEKIAVHCTQKTRLKYEAEKKKLFESLGAKDPHTLPRQLHLVAGPEKLLKLEPDKNYLGRNNRFKLPNMQTYKEDVYSESDYTVFEFCHNFIDFSDFLSLTRQTTIPILSADLKAEEWYFERYTKWLENLKQFYSIIKI